MKRPQLAIDTSTEYLSVALRYDNNVLLHHEKVVNKHSEKIIPVIAQLLHQANISIKDIQLIAYTAGPGAFTGLRIGLAVIKGIALPRNIPLVAIPTLDYIAYQGRNIHSSYVINTIVALMDARMGEVFSAQYQRSPFKAITKPTILTRDSELFNQFLNQHNTVLIGNVSPIKLLAHHNMMVKMPKAELLFCMLDELDYPTTTAAHASLSYLRNKVALTLKEQQSHAK